MDHICQNIKVLLRLPQIIIKFKNKLILHIETKSYSFEAEKLLHCPYRCGAMTITTTAHCPIFSKDKCADFIYFGS